MLPSARHLFLLLVAPLAAAGPTVGRPRVLADPPANITPPALLDATGACHRHAGRWLCPSPCAPHLRFGYNTSPGCSALALRALEMGRHAEGLAPLALPTNFARLSPAEQLFVLVNLERIARSVPPLVGLSSDLDLIAARAAARGADASATAVLTSLHASAMGATWAGGAPNATAATFGWIYDDGWSGSATTNLDCTSAHSPECWGHRRVLLGAATGTACRRCVAGAAYSGDVRGQNEPSYEFVIARTSASVSLSFTWNRNVLPHLPSRGERVPAGS